MHWPFTRKPRRPAEQSAEVKRAIEMSDRELLEAQRLRQAAQEVGSSLDVSRDVNHYAIALAAVLRGGEK